MENYKFHKTLLFLLISCVVASDVYAEENEEPSNEITRNPHSQIGLTKQISALYSGKGVKIGVLDSGYMVEHPLVNQEKLLSLSFETTDTKGARKVFDPTHYDTEKEKDENGEEKLVYSMHGGQVAGIIGAKSLSSHNYKGGVAQNSNVYITTFEPKESSSDDDSEADNKNADLLLGTGSDVKNHQRAVATAFNKLTNQKVFAINNSWNEDSSGDHAQLIDNKYKMAVTKARDNLLLNAIKGAIKKETLFVFAAGNESKKQPGVMAALPRYLPELEKHYLSVVAVDDGKNLAKYSNHCGISKNWCVAAPGNLTVLATEGAEQNKKIPNLQNEFGTSFAAPTITGALAVLKERFNYFTPTQVRDTLLTTATDLGRKGVDEIFGWGLVNISKAMNGPSQLLGDEIYTLSRNDKWINNLSGEHNLTKRGKAELTLAGENNRLKAINIDEGTLTLSGKTSVDRINNLSNLSISALTVNQSFKASNNSHLKILTPKAFAAQGKGTLVELNGTLSIEESLKQNAKAGDTLADILIIKDGANYSGGFEQLTPSNTLNAKGLRQDIYFKEDRVELKANLNTAFSAPHTSENGKNGLQILNSLRNSKIALKKGFYNNWLQKAIEYNDLQNLHYYVTNNIYADSIEFLRNQAALRSQHVADRLSDEQNNDIGAMKVWLEGEGQKYQSNKKEHDKKLDVKTRYSGFGIAYKPNEKVILNGNLVHINSDIAKTQATATIKQVETSAGLRYMPTASSWFTDVISKVARIDYKQTRSFNSVKLGAGNNKGWLFSGELRSGYNFKFNNWDIEPTIGLQALHLSMDTLKENGELPTITNTFKKKYANASAGLHLKKYFKTGDWQITPNLTLNYIQRLNSKRDNVNSTLNGIKINNEPTTSSKYSAEISLGISLEKNNWIFSSIFKQYQFKNSKATNWQAKIGFTF